MGQYKKSRNKNMPMWKLECRNDTRDQCKVIGYLANSDGTTGFSNEKINWILPHIIPIKKCEM